MNHYSNTSTHIEYITGTVLFLPHQQVWYCDDKQLNSSNNTTAAVCYTVTTNSVITTARMVNAMRNSYIRLQQSDYDGEDDNEVDEKPPGCTLPHDWLVDLATIVATEWASVGIIYKCELLTCC